MVARRIFLCISVTFCHMSFGDDINISFLDSLAVSGRVHIDGDNFNGIFSPSKIECWHSDMTYSNKPPLGTVLRSRIIPEVGGDTLWSSMTAAFNGLSSNMQEMLKGLSAVHDFSHGFQETLSQPEGRKRLKLAIKENPPVTHPVINIHPITKKFGIYVNELFTTKITNLPKSESDYLLNFLFNHIKTPEFTCRFNWSKNAVVIWDNRSTQHKPINDYFPASRRLERITIESP